ncbi:MAG: hypothetical protein M5U12_23285 [Verrucomicrobia bacterium]|nr:hypothetical protein [Verrucomicrobiota bacterium]
MCPPKTPSNLGWAKQETRAAAPAPTVIGLTLKDLRLSDWRALVGTNVHEGLVNLQATIISADNGRRLTADLSNTVERLELALGDTLWKDLGAVFSGRLSLSDYRTVSFEGGQFTYLEGRAELLKSRITASYDLVTQGGNIEIASNGELPVLLSRHPVPELHFDRGTLGASVLLNWASEKYSGGVTLQVGNADGTVGGYRVDGYSAQFDATGELHRDKFVLRRLGLSARESTRNGGTVELVGQFDGSTQTAQLNLNVSGLNQAGLRPFLAPTWPTHDLTSATIKATGELRYDAGAMPPINLDDTARLRRLADQLAAGIGTTTLRLNAEATNLIVQSRADGKSSPLRLYPATRWHAPGRTLQSGDQPHPAPPPPARTERTAPQRPVRLGPPQPHAQHARRARRVAGPDRLQRPGHRAPPPPRTPPPPPRPRNPKSNRPLSRCRSANWTPRWTSPPCTSARSRCVTGRPRLSSKTTASPSPPSASD